MSLYRPFRARPPLSAGHACRWTQNLRHRWHDISAHHCEVRRPAPSSCLCHHRCHRSHRAIVPSSAGCHPLSSLVATPPSFALHIPAFPLRHHLTRAPFFASPTSVSPSPGANEATMSPLYRTTTHRQWRSLSSALRPDITHLASTLHCPPLRLPLNPFTVHC